MSLYLITGVAGFIASRTASQLLKQGHRVIGVDNLNDYYDIRLKEYRLKSLLKEEKFRFHKLDIERFEEIEPLFKEHDFDAVINLAARAGVRYSLEHPQIYLSTNTNASLNLLELMRHYGVKKKILASSSSLYSGQTMPFVETLAVNEPISPYAASKKAAEVLCYTYHYQYELDISILRLFTVYGPAGRPDMSTLRFIKWIDEGKPIQLYGDGNQSRDFTYIDDIVRGILLALKPIGYEIINLGGGNQPVSINYTIQFIEQSLGEKAIIKKHPFHKGDIQSTWANIGKAKELLSWEPEVSLEEGLNETIKWYLENKSWFKNIQL